MNKIKPIKYTIYFNLSFIVLAICLFFDKKAGILEYILMSIMLINLVLYVYYDEVSKQKDYKGFWNEVKLLFINPKKNRKQI